MGPVVTAATTAALPVDAIVVHVEAGEPAAADAAFRAGHLPGARLLLRDVVTSAPVGPGDGRHPLPTPEDFADALGRHGIDQDSIVLAYDREGGASAARLVYLLRILGQEAAVLDGGLAGWEEVVEHGDPPIPAAVTTAVRSWPIDRLATADQVAEHIARGGVVVDARSTERFVGTVEPLDAVAGHIPGAVNVPFSQNISRDGLFRAPPKLHTVYERLGVDSDTILYCGSGVTACHDLLAIEHAGLGLPRLYVGSWSQWCRDEARPVATGPAK